MNKKLIIFENKELFNILDEINEIFEFKLEFCEKENKLDKLNQENSSNFLVVTKKKISNINNFLFVVLSPSFNCSC